MKDTIENRFILAFNTLAYTAARIAESKGWYVNKDSVENISSKIALMHSELSEALESLRNGDPESEHIPGYTGMEEEFADVIIRIMHVAYSMDLKVSAALIAKLEFNKTRKHKHGGKSI